MNTTPQRHDSTSNQSVPDQQAPQGFPGSSNVSSRGSAGFPNPLKATPALKILQEAVFYIDAANSQAGERWAINQGSGGAALNARYGSGVSANTNDPLWLSRPVDGTNYAYLSGSADDVFTVPDEAALSITGDFEYVVRISPSSWLTLNQTLLCKSDSVSQRGVEWRLSTGSMNLALSSNGSSITTVVASASIPAGTGWLKVTWRASDGRCQFFTAADEASEPSSWTQYAGDQTAAVGAIFDNTSVVRFGNRASSLNPFTGGVYRMIIRNGIGGSTVLDINTATDVTSSAATTFTATSGQTVTVNRSTSGRKTVLVTRPVWLFGTDDYFETANHPLLDLSRRFTALAVIRRWTTLGTSDSIMSKSNASEAGWMLNTGAVGTTPRFLFSDGVNAVIAAAPALSASGVLESIYAVRGATAVVGINATTGTAVTDAIATPSNSSAFRIGRLSGASTEYIDCELLAAAVFRRALSTAEIAAINTHYETA